jgi:5-methyltetrahydropteroyltriglutamate--homocysteine methyltransferase
MLSNDVQLLDGLEVPPECRVSLDITTAGAAAGPFDPAGVRVFCANLPYSRVCVEFPPEPDRRFPIGELAEGTVVSLGIVDLGLSGLEDVDDLVGIVDEAATIVDVDNIALSTNGGFHASRLSLTPDQGRAKLQLVEMVARYIWGNEL